ncbi:gcn5-related n-acetyltransferase [Pyrenochaeta sp. DS3sAY3a]|nr:gcn5-related n-acetyltransferase [Pyrenochaeta sp. DS3sAY3a]
MVPAKDALLRQSWKKDTYLISTDPSLIPVDELNRVFGSEVFYWADALPVSVMSETLENSLCFGLYDLESPESASYRSKAGGAYKLIGFARCITNFTTFVFLTDVYVDPILQGKGLGAWLITCVQESIKSLPYLRRSMLFTSDWKRSVPFYAKLMGMEVVECIEGAEGEEGKGAAIMQYKGPAFPSNL